MNTYQFTQTFTIEAVELGCGHIIFMTTEHVRDRRRDHETFYCTHCGSRRHWPGESDLEKLRRERDAALQREETHKAMRRNLETALAKEQKSKARLKKRAAAGVCPCCTRSFQNLRRHMETKHPAHAGAES